MARRAGPLAEISPGDAEISASGLEKFSYKTRHPGNRAENYHSAHVKFADQKEPARSLTSVQCSLFSMFHLLYKIVSFSQNISKNSLISPQLINFPHYNDSIELKY